MKNTIMKVLALVLALAMVLAIVACKKTAVEPAADPGKATEKPVATETAEPMTLVVGYSFFSEKFSPFFAKTDYDMDVAEITGLLLMDADREGNPVLGGIKGETVAFNGTDYFYSGISDIEVVQNTDGSVDYKVTMRDDIKFSDGTPMTIDDVIFSLYVNSDPTFDGGATFYSLPIEGMEEYRASMQPLGSLIAAAGKDNTDFSKWTEAQQTKYWDAFVAAGTPFAQEIVDYCVDNGYTVAADYYGNEVVGGMVNWGYGSVSDAGVLEGLPSGKTYDLAGGVFPTAADYFSELLANYGYDASDNGINLEKAETDFADFLTEALGADAATYAAGVNVGEVVPNIKGIIRTGDNSLTVHCTKFEASSIYQFGLIVAPLHYYGDKAQYDYAKNQFGFPKGDLSGIKEKTTKPLGAGPYKFISYENGVVTFEANENYWKGEPKIKYLLFQETVDGDKVSGVASGTFDLTDPSFSTDTVAAVRGYNDNGELTGNAITTSTVDNLGYGYIGLCAYNVKVGNETGSDASKALRKGLATVLASFRETVVFSYYGERASVIQYPISNTSWAAPKPNDEGYQEAFSTDVDGKPIYTDDMTAEQRADAALAAAVGFLKAAGYTYDDANKKFTAAPAGAKMAYEVIIPADGVGDHPAYGILTAAKEALAKIGITLEINDPSDSNVLWNAIEAVPATAELWCAAWQATPDPDMYQVYYSTNINGAGGTDSNHYYVTDKALDELMLEARASADRSFRKATYKECLDMILDWAVEIPNYQRQNAVIFSTERINISTLTPDITTFWGWAHDIELLELN